MNSLLCECTCDSADCALDLTLPYFPPSVDSANLPAPSFCLRAGLLSADPLSACDVALSSVGPVQLEPFPLSLWILQRCLPPQALPGLHACVSLCRSSSPTSAAGERQHSSCTEMFSIFPAGCCAITQMFWRQRGHSEGLGKGRLTLGVDCREGTRSPVFRWMYSIQQ